MKNVMEQKKYRNIVIITGVIFIIIIVALYFFLVAPLKKDLERAKAQLQTENELLQILEQNVEVEGEEEAHFVDAVERLPNESFIEYYIMQLEDIATKTGVEITDYSFSLQEGMGGNGGAAAANDAENDETEQNSSTSSVEELITNISIKANSYRSLFSFLEELEELRRVTYISSFTMNEPTGDEGGELHSDLLLRTFYLPNLDEDHPPSFNIDFINPSGKGNPF